MAVREFHPGSDKKEAPMTTDAPIDDPAALTSFIETRFHEIHREQLPDLAALALKVKRVHGDQPEAPHGLSALLQRLIGELEVHMKNEELILFPAIRRGGMPGIENPIAVMRADHDDHSAEIECIRALTNNLTLPEGACRSWTALYDGLKQFIADLEAHVRLENDMLFPHFEAR
jgi:regulator of cell morphogenesis and NO signaling